MSSSTSAQRKLAPNPNDSAFGQSGLRLGEMESGVERNHLSSQSFQSTTTHRRSKDSLTPHLVPLRRATVKPNRVGQWVRGSLAAAAACLIVHLAMGACQQVAQGLYLAQQAPVWQQYQSQAARQQSWYHHQLKQLASPISLEKRAREQMDYATAGETLVAVQTY